MDTFYLVVASDRHSDDEYALYRNIGAAIDEAQRRVNEAASHYHAKPEELRKKAFSNWIFYAALEDAFSIRVESIIVKP